MIKKYVYTGKALVGNGVMGVCFREIENKEKLLCWKGRESYYAIGGIYEIETKDNKIIILSIKYLNEDVNEKEINEFKIKDAAVRTEVKAKQVAKKLKSEREDLGSITLSELKNNYNISRSAKIAFVAEYLV